MEEGQDLTGKTHRDRDKKETMKREVEAGEKPKKLVRDEAAALRAWRVSQYRGAPRAQGPRDPHTGTYTEPLLP